MKVRDNNVSAETRLSWADLTGQTVYAELFKDWEGSVWLLKSSCYNSPSVGIFKPFGKDTNGSETIKRFNTKQDAENWAYENGYKVAEHDVLAKKILKFEKAGAVVSALKYMEGYFKAEFPNGSIVEFCKDDQSISYGYDESIQETLRFFYDTPSKAIKKALANIKLVQGVLVSDGLDTIDSACGISNKTKQSLVKSVSNTL